MQAITEPAALVASDRAVLYDMVFDEYTLAGDRSLGAELLVYCPWCGAELPVSKRDRWFGELARLGLDPDDPGLDERFLSDAWWRSTPSVPGDGSTDRPLGS